MNIDIITKNITLDGPLTVFCQRVIADLEKHVNILDSKKEVGDEATVKGWLEVGKTTRHHRKGPFFRAECQIFLPGRTIRAESEAADLRVAITDVKDETQRQLKDYKEKTITKRRKGGRAIKSAEEGVE